MEMTKARDNALDQNKIVAAVFIDVKKAFDSVNHEIIYYRNFTAPG